MTANGAPSRQVPKTKRVLMHAEEGQADKVAFAFPFGGNDPSISPGQPMLNMQVTLADHERELIT
ncbi:hypothetical protein ACIPWF_07110 [Paenarthrobacter sp. NPDC089989]|uniref:hypothetical protein n=1 Tax=unclassified Paenarthrobacter TaxID=2634190 RepID=UPI00380128FA